MSPLTYGPLNKSLFTQTFELILKSMLYAPEKINYHIQIDGHNQSHLWVTLGTNEINLSALLHKVNFSHIQLTEADSEKYLPLAPPHAHQDSHPELSNSEIDAIQYYTGSGYLKINSLLYGKLDRLYAFDYETWEYHSELLPSLTQDTLLKIGFLASGENKILPSLAEFETFRGEHKISTQEIAYRIQLIDNGGGLTDESAFLSTSSDIEVGNAFKGNSLIIFDAPYGKDLSALSLIYCEKEFLLPPSTLLWESYEQTENETIFHARVVAPLIEGKEDPTENDIIDLKHLLDWATEEGVPTDFLTPHLAHQVFEQPQPMPALESELCCFALI